MAVNEVSMKGGECDPLTRSPCLGRDKARRFVAASSLVISLNDDDDFCPGKSRKFLGIEARIARTKGYIGWLTVQQSISENKSFEKSLFTINDE